MKAEKYKIDSIDIKLGDVILANLSKSDGSPVFNFLPGQYAMLALRDENGKLTEEKPFSIASSPSRKEYLQFGIKIVGRFTKKFVELKSGDEIYVFGPFGNFVFNPEKHSNAVFIAGGVGITPFMSSFRYAFDNNLQNNLTLLYSARTMKGALFFDEIRQLEEKNHNFKAYFAVTDEEVSVDAVRVKKCFIDARMISDVANYDFSNKDFFLCGPPPFMIAMISCLRSMGVSQDKIYTEKFSMLPSLGESLRDKLFKYMLGGASVSVLIILVSVAWYEAQKATIKVEIKKQKDSFLKEANTLSKRQNPFTQPQETIQSQTPSQQSSQTSTTQIQTQKTTPVQSQPTTQAPTASTQVQAQPQVQPAPQPVIEPTIITPRTTLS